MQRERDGLHAALRQWEEREAACCPEDVGFEEYVAALREAAGRAAPPVPGWQPIATAPKDGTQLLVFSQRATRLSYCVVFWRDEFSDWYSLDLQSFYAPTHWMPLPAPPGSPVAPTGPGWPTYRDERPIIAITCDDEGDYIARDLTREGLIVHDETEAGALRKLLDVRPAYDAMSKSPPVAPTGQEPPP